MTAGEKRPKRVAFQSDVVDNEGASKKRRLDNAQKTAELQAAKIAEEEDREHGLEAEEGDPDLEQDFEEDDVDEEKVESERLKEVEGEEEDEVVEAFGDKKDDVPLEPFNLRKENEEGFFDKDGTYVHHRDKEAEQGDAWLQGNEVVSEEVARRHREQWTYKGETLEDSAEDLQSAIVELLQPNETVVRALRRYKGSDSNKNKNKNRQGKKVDDTPKPGQDMEKFTKLTECADKLLSLGHYNIYEETPASLRLKIGKGPVSGSAPTVVVDVGAGSSTATSPAVGIQWEYKWGMDATDVYGPFTSTDMRTWSEQGHFTDLSVVVRHAGTNLPFAPIEKVQFRGP